MPASCFVSIGNKAQESLGELGCVCSGAWPDGEQLLGEQRLLRLEAEQFRREQPAMGNAHQACVEKQRTAARRGWGRDVAGVRSFDQLLQQLDDVAGQFDAILEVKGWGIDIGHRDRHTGGDTAQQGHADVHYSGP